MKLHINLPDVQRGDELEVMFVGRVKQGDTIELTDSQVRALEDAGYKVSGDSMELYTEAAPSKEAEVKTDNLPGIEVIAERERSKTSRKASTKSEGDK